MGIAQYRGLDELAGAVGRTAVQQFRPLAHCIVDMPGDFADRRRIDQRADGHALFQTVADLEFAHFLHQPCSEAVINAVLHQNAVGAHAGLPGVAEFAEHDARHCLFQVRVVKHDEGRVAAQFQAQTLDVFGALAH